MNLKRDSERLNLRFGFYFDDQFESYVFITSNEYSRLDWRSQNLIKRFNLKRDYERLDLQIDFYIHEQFESHVPLTSNEHS